MFQAVIRNTPLTTESADLFFKNIQGESFRDDKSFLATLRALVSPRMSESDFLSLSFYPVRETKEDIDEQSVEDALCEICRVHRDSFSDEGRIRIYNVYSQSSSDNDAVFDFISSNFEGCMEGWERVQKVTVFYRKAFRVLCYVNPQIKSAVLFCDSLSVKRMHYLQCAIFAFLPWYFPMESGASEEEMDLLNSLRSKDEKDYIRAIDVISKKFDLRSAKIRHELNGFEAKFAKKELESENSQLNRIMYNIRECDKQLADLYDKKYESEIRVMGLQSKISDVGDRNELMEYFLKNDRLILDNVDDADLTIVCGDYVEYYNEDLAKKVIDNPNSVIYNDSLLTDDEIKRLFYAIFIDNTLRMKFCAAYKIYFNKKPESLAHYVYPDEMRDYMPNPHIDAYRCIGDYDRVFGDMVMNHDYVAICEQLMASCKSLNFGDGAVMEEFVKALYGRNNVNNKCIELPNGSVVDPKGAIAWLDEQEGSNE